MSAMVTEAVDLQAEHEERLRTDPAYLQAYRDQVAEWSRSLSPANLLLLVQEYNRRRRGGEKKHPVELVDAVREYVRRHPTTRRKYPEIFGQSGGYVQGRLLKRSSHVDMLDDPISV